MGNSELKIFSGQKGYVGTEKFRRGSDFAKPGKLLKIFDFTLSYPHVTFKIIPEGNHRKETKNEISVKVFLDVETVNILDEYDLEDDI